MTQRTPRERLNDAAELLGLPERLAPECGQAQWTEVLTKIIATLAQEVTTAPPKSGDAAGAVRT